MPKPAVAQRLASDRRRHRRVGARLDACLDVDGHLIPCVIVDVSAGGTQILASLPRSLERGRLEIEAYGVFECRVAWSNETHAGLEFCDDPQATALRLAALLRGP